MNSPVSNWRQTKNIHLRIDIVGKVLSWTKIYVAPLGYEGDTPYYAGIVEFGKGIKETMQFVDFEGEPVIGQKVITVVRRLGKPKPQDVIQYGIKVKPILDRRISTDTGSEQI